MASCHLGYSKERWLPSLYTQYASKCQPSPRGLTGIYPSPLGHTVEMREPKETPRWVPDSEDDMGLTSERKPRSTSPFSEVKMRSTGKYGSLTPENLSLVVTVRASSNIPTLSTTQRVGNDGSAEPGWPRAVVRLCFSGGLSSLKKEAHVREQYAPKDLSDC